MLLVASSYLQSCSTEMLEVKTASRSIIQTEFTSLGQREAARGQLTALPRRSARRRLGSGAGVLLGETGRRAMLLLRRQARRRAVR